jgi:hypothetical protein
MHFYSDMIIVTGTLLQTGKPTTSKPMLEQIVLETRQNWFVQKPFVLFERRMIDPIEVRWTQAKSSEIDLQTSTTGSKKL